MIDAPKDNQPEDDTTMFRKAWYKNVEVWVYGGIQTFIGGGASSAAACVIDPVKFNLNDGLGNVGKMFLAAGVMNLMSFLAKSPLPQMPTSNSMKTLLITAILILSTLSCKNPEQALFVGATSVNSAEELAIGGFDSYRQNHEVPVETVLKVRNAALAYRSANQLFLASIAAFKSAQSADAKDKADAAASALSSASANLLSLIAAVNPDLLKTQPKH